MAAGLVYHDFTTSSGVTFSVACWVPDTTAPNVGCIPVQVLMKTDGTVLDPSTLAQGGGKTLADVTTALATLNTDQGTLHADIATTLHGDLGAILTALGHVGAGTASGTLRATLASDDPAVAVLGTTAGTAVITDAAGTIQQYLRGLVKLIAAKIGITIADGDFATLGAKADAASTATDTTAITAMSVFKQISKSVQAAFQPASGSDGSGTITAGATAQNLFSAATPTNGYSVSNPDPTEDLWASNSTTAAPNGQGSFRIAANGGYYETPPGFKPYHAISLYGATTGHKFTAEKW